MTRTSKSYAAAFVGADLGGFLGAVAGWSLGAGLAELGGARGLAALGLAIAALLAAVPIGVCAGYWTALTLVGHRPRLASVAILVGLMVAAYAFRILIDNAAWAQALFDWLGPFQAGHAVTALIVLPGLFALLAHALGDR